MRIYWVWFVLSAAGWSASKLATHILYLLYSSEIHDVSIGFISCYFFIFEELIAPEKLRRFPHPRLAQWPFARKIGLKASPLPQCTTAKCRARKRTPYPVPEVIGWECGLLSCILVLHKRKKSISTFTFCRSPVPTFPPQFQRASATACSRVHI
jgi:hypothetical protein